MSSMRPVLRFHTASRTSVRLSLLNTGCAGRPVAALAVKLV